MKGYSKNVHEQAMWNAMQELKSRRMDALGHLMTGLFIAGWAVVVLAMVI